MQIVAKDMIMRPRLSDTWQHEMPRLTKSEHGEPGTLMQSFQNTVLIAANILRREGLWALSKAMFVCTGPRTIAPNENTRSWRVPEDVVEYLTITAKMVSVHSIEADLRIASGPCAVVQHVRRQTTLV